MAVFTRESKKFLLIIGPCSAHDEDAVCDYISRLARIQDEVKEKIIIIPRIYTNKPRTTGIGYKGMAHQPKLKEEPNIVEGIKAHYRRVYDAAREKQSSMKRPVPIAAMGHLYTEGGELRSFVNVFLGVTEDLPFSGGPGRSVHAHHLIHGNAEKRKRVTFGQVFRGGEG